MRKYQVFLSSTYEDLKEERQECIRALLELDCIPAGMEMFPASTDDAWTLIKRVIDNSDYFILIIKGKYGSINKNSNIGYTEMEYDYAVSIGIPIISFIWKEIDRLPIIYCEKDKRAKRRLADFRKKATERVVKWWDNEEQLYGALSRSLAASMRVRPGVGWVRASAAEIESQKSYVQGLRARTEQLEKAIDELRQSDPLKSAVVQIKERYVEEFEHHDFTNRILCSEVLNFIYKTLPGYEHLSGYVEAESEIIEAFLGEEVPEKTLVRFLKVLSGYGLIRKKKKGTWKVLPYGKQIKSLLDIGY